MSSRRLRAGAVGVASIAAIAVAAPTGTATAAARNHARVGLHYAVNRPVCSQTPKPGRATCFAVRRIEATKSTPGAVSYHVQSAYPVGLGGGLTPADLTTAYGMTTSATGGVGQIVAIVDAYDDPNILADLDHFDATYEIKPDGVNTTESATSFVKVGQTGSTAALPKADRTGWSGEESLDVESVRSICNQCTILLVETNSPNDADLIAGVRAAVKLGADEVSNSYGGPEDPRWSKSLRKRYAKDYNYPGVVVTASTGDDGWFTWDPVNAFDGQKAKKGPNLPSSLPNVTSVGGTQLNLNDDATRKSETVWNDNGPGNLVGLSEQFGGPDGATGGGCSVLYGASGWQAGTSGFQKTGCGTSRLAADISADGSPESGLDVYDTYACLGCGQLPPNGWQPIGGTSLSSPLIAAMWALAGGADGVAFPSMTLYGEANKPPSTMYDVTKGGNSWCGGATHAKCIKDLHLAFGTKKISNPNFVSVAPDAHPKRYNLGVVDCGFKPNTASSKAVKADAQCNAGNGIDGPTGLGTPTSLATFLPLTVRPAVKHGSAVHKKATKFHVGGSDPFPGAVWGKAHWKFGDGKTGGGVKPKHTYKKAGTYTVSVKATDIYGNVATATASVTVK